MKLKITSSPMEKIKLFPFLLSLVLVCSSMVAAQNENSPRDLTSESPSKVTESAPDAAANLEKAVGGDSSDLRKTLETNGKVEKTIPEVESKNEKVEGKFKRFKTFYGNENKTSDTNFDFAGKDENRVKFFDSTSDGKEKNRFRQIPAVKNSLDDSADALPPDESFRWRSAVGQSLMFLAVQHGYAFTQPKTREALKGKFWKDYAQSVKNLHGWSDGGRFFTNYIAHPMQGSMTGFIYVQNDPKALKQQFGASGDYWRSRTKAMLWTAAWSTQFEIGPVSQASIGNVGLKGKQTWEDIVVTPTLGTAMLIGEDAVDRFIMKRIERATDNFYAVIFSRMLLSPTRVFANLLRFKPPWHRDRPREH